MSDKIKPNGLKTKVLGRISIFKHQFLPISVFAIALMSEITTLKILVENPCIFSQITNILTIKIYGTVP